MNELILSANVVALVKSESTYGAVAAYADADAVIFNSGTLKIDYTSVDANLMTVERGSQRKKFAYKKGTFEVTCDFALGGADETPVAGALPQTDALLKACAMQRLQSTTIYTGTLDSGSRDAVVLPSGASSVNKFYNGLSLAVKIVAGTTQAPGSTAKNIVKLAATQAEHSGTAGGTSTTTAIKLAATASTVDDDYVGQTIVIGGEEREITVYVGSTQIATVGTAFGSATAGENYKIWFSDDALVGYTFGITHYTGTIIDTVDKNSSASTIFLPSSVGSATLTGTIIDVTTGANDPERVRIKAYDIANRKASLQTPLQVTPTSSSTFKIIEKRRIKAFDAATKVCTLKTNLVVASVTGKDYAVEQPKNIISYNGTTKRAEMLSPFSRNVGAADFTINPYVMYSALPTKSGEVSCTIAFYQDGFFYELVGCKGSFVVTENNGESVVIKFNLQGRVNVYDDMDLPDITLSRYVPSLVQSSTNSPEMLFQGYDQAVVHTFEVDMGLDTKYRDVDQRAFNTDHAPTLKVKIDKPLKADWDWEELMRLNGKATTCFVLGRPGNQVVTYLENTQITGATDSDQDGVVTLDLDMMVTNGLKRLVFN